MNDDKPGPVTAAQIIFVVACTVAAGVIAGVLVLGITK